MVKALYSQFALSLPDNAEPRAESHESSNVGDKGDEGSINVSDGSQKKFSEEISTKNIIRKIGK